MTTATAPAVSLSSFSTELQRTHWCRDAAESKVGETFLLNGWVDVNRDLGGIIFIELRDKTGLIQLVADPQVNPEVHAVLNSLRSEAVIAVKGSLSMRPEDTLNPEHASGTVEIYPTEVHVLSRSKPLPFPLDDADNVDESIRLRHRYLDLRRPAMTNNLRLRHTVVQAMREVLNRHEFTEIETPTLIRSTPEGARDYLVPSRVHPGHLYALPQSPQLFKQLLMMGGQERYYQVARCYRDEDLRADRQPEFTQIDIELSFTTQDSLMALIEELIVSMFSTAGVTLQAPFRRMTWDHAMRTYGSDKPDLRFGLEFVDLTDAFKESSFAVFKEPANKGIVLALKVPGAASYSRKELDDLQKDAKRYGAKGLAYIVYGEEGPKSPILKYLSEAEQQAVQEQTGAQTGDAVFFMADTHFAKACETLGRFRLQFAEKQGLIDPNQHEITWVVDFPMFDQDPETGALSSNHHPFTAPNPDDLHLLHSAPEKMRSQGYDLAYNGSEIGGGSIRIHDSGLQAQMLNLLGFSDESAREQFGFLLDALEYGAPPHGGIALGLDRITALLAGTSSIRDVMAFPKNNAAQCLLSNAPGEPEQPQLDDLFMQFNVPEEQL